MLRRLVIHCIGLLLVGGLLAPPALADEAVTLGGTNVVNGSVTSRVTVRLEHQALLDLTPAATETGEMLPRALQVDGEGDFVGFALTEPLSTDGFFAVAARAPQLGPEGHGFVAHGQPAVENRDDGGPLPSAAPTCVRCVVPAGEYHLYLITGFREATVTFTLEGLEGAAEFTTDERGLRTNEGMGNGQHWFQGGGTAVSGGGSTTWFWTSHESPEPGLLLHAYRSTAPASGEAPVTALVEHCESAGDGTSCKQAVDLDVAHDAAGFAVAPGAMTDDGVSASVGLTAAGAGSYTVGQAILWLPLNDFIHTAGVVRKDDDARIDINAWTQPAR